MSRPMAAPRAATITLKVRDLAGQRLELAEAWRQA